MELIKFDQCSLHYGEQVLMDSIDLSIHKGQKICLVGRNGTGKSTLLKMMMGEAIELPDARWDTLAIRWGLFFFAMAALNEFIWRTQTEDFWATFKVFGFLPITFIFTLTQIPFIQKHGKMRGEA